MWSLPSSKPKPPEEIRIPPLTELLQYKLANLCFRVKSKHRGEKQPAGEHWWWIKYTVEFSWVDFCAVYNNTKTFTFQLERSSESGQSSNSCRDISVWTRVTHCHPHRAGQHQHNYKFCSWVSASGLQVSTMERKQRVQVSLRREKNAHAAKWLHASTSPYIYEAAVFLLCWNNRKQKKTKKQHVVCDHRRQYRGRGQLSAATLISVSLIPKFLLFNKMMIRFIFM